MVRQRLPGLAQQENGEDEQQRRRADNTPMQYRHDEAAARSGGEPVLHLEVGQPSARPPDAVLEAARLGLEEPLGYTDALGTAELRRAIAEFYAERSDTMVTPDRIAVTSGASAGCSSELSAAYCASRL